MSQRQVINWNEWNVFDEDANPTYPFYLSNYLENTWPSPHVPDLPARAEQPNYTSFDQDPGLDRTYTQSSAPDAFSHQNNPSHNHCNPSWPSRLNNTHPNHDLPGHTASMSSAKHRSLKTKTSHIQSSKLSNRRHGKQKADHSISLICKWAKCTSPGPFSCKATIMRHVENQHVAPRSVPCLDEGCDRLFSRKDNMVGHFRSVHGEARSEGDWTYS